MNAIINFFIDNWLYIIIIIAVIVVGSVAIKRFYSLNIQEQKNKIKEWLLYAVITAESELGSGTGRLKLATVYDMFIQAFPIIKNFVSIEVFSKWVDEVLNDMRHLLETNKNINDIVIGDINN